MLPDWLHAVRITTVPMVPNRFKQTTNSQHNNPIAANVLDRDFTAAAPNQRWVGDTTEFVMARTPNSMWRQFSICIPGSSSAGRSAP